MTDDSWKGESLIRSVKRDNVATQRFAAKHKTASVEQRAERKCLFPGCETILQSRSSTGLCRAHGHTKPYCQCAQCRSK